MYSMSLVISPANCVLLFPSSSAGCRPTRCVTQPSCRLSVRHCGSNTVKRVQFSAVADTGLGFKAGGQSGLLC